MRISRLSAGDRRAERDLAVTRRGILRRQSIRILMWRRGPRHSTVFLRWADPMHVRKGHGSVVGPNSIRHQRIG